MFTMNSTIQLSYVLIIILILLISLGLIYFIIIKQLKNKLNEQSNLIYLLLKKNDICNDRLYQIIEDNNSIKETVESLSTSLETFIKEANKQSIQYPNPNMVKMIEDTINDQIGIEITLAHNMTLKPKDMLTIITDNTIKTYPMISPEYITKKCIVMVESLRQQKNDDK